VESAWDNVKLANRNDTGTPLLNYDAFKVRANFTQKNWGAGFNQESLTSSFLKTS